MVASALRNVVPLSGSISPAPILRSVDLPDPLRPTRHRRSPAATRRSTSSSSGVPPKVNAMPLSWSNGVAISVPDRICFFHNADVERILLRWNLDRRHKGTVTTKKKGRPCGWPFHCRTVVRLTDRDAWGHAAWTSVEARIQLTVAGAHGN